MVVRAMNPVMGLVPKVALSLAGIALVAGGARLWAEFGQLVYFDIIAASFIGCFF